MVIRSGQLTRRGPVIMEASVVPRYKHGASAWSAGYKTSGPRHGAKRNDALLYCSRFF